jgi:hypothetical protein
VWVDSQCILEVCSRVGINRLPLGWVWEGGWCRILCWSFRQPLQHRSQIPNFCRCQTRCVLRWLLVDSPRWLGISDWCRQMSILLYLGRSGLGACLWSVRCSVSIVIVVVIIIVIVLVVVVILLVVVSRLLWLLSGICSHRWLPYLL